MRLTVRLLALILLLAIGTFAYFGSRTTRADDTGFLIDESGNPCYEGCFRGYEGCSGKCGYNQDCQRKCREERDKCEASCR